MKSETLQELSELTIEGLVFLGFKQVSRKYRILARLPKDMTGLEALATYDPDLAKRILDNANQSAAEYYLRCCPDAECVKLTIDEFNDYLRLTGRVVKEDNKIKTNRSGDD
jgi:hypothetical protein